MSDQIERSLGLWRSWALVVGCVIGSAIFMMPAVLAPYGGLGLISWGAAGAGAVLVAVMLGDLARRLPRVGGPYAYARAGFGDFAGFLVAWGYWISLWAACAAIAIGFVAYLGVFFPAITQSPTVSVSVGLAVIWSLIGVNYLGVRETGIMALVTTLLKLLPLIAIGLAGLFAVEVQDLPRMNPTGRSGLSVFAAASALGFFTFLGLEAASVPAGHVVAPKKTIPRALLLGTLTVAAVYLISGYAVAGLVPPDVLAHSSAPFADAAVRLVGEWGGFVVAGGALVATYGSLNGAILLNSQTAMAAAMDGLFPAPFKRISSRRTPGFSLLATGVLASFLLVMNYTKGLIGAYTFIILIATITTVVPYAFAAMAGLALGSRGRQGGRQTARERWVAVLAFIVCLWVIAGAGAETVYWGFLLLLAGLPVYVLVTRGKAPSSL